MRSESSVSPVLSEPTQEFSKAQSIIKSACVGCHNSGGSARFASFDLSSEEEFITKGWIIPGDPDNSKLIYRTKGYTAPENSSLANRGFPNMPPSGSISLSDFIVLRDWVIATASKRDQDPPLVQILSPQEFFQTEGILTLAGQCEFKAGDVNISGDIIDLNAGIQCSEDGRFATEVELAGVLGEKTVVVEQTDRSGNVGLTKRKFIKADLTAPHLTIDSPLAGFRSTEAIELSGHCEVGSSSLRILGDIQSVSPIVCKNDGTYLTSLTFSEGEGVKLIVVSQQDSSGNTASIQRSFERIAVNQDDVTPPEITIVRPSVNAETEANILLEGLCEVGAGPVLIGGDVIQQNSSCTNSGTYSVIIELIGEIGLKNIQVSQQDNAGNLGFISRSFQKVDRTAPLVTIDSPPVNEKHHQGLTVTGRCEAGAKLLEFSGQILPVVSKTCTDGTYSVSIQFSGSPGSKIFMVSQQDASGNTGAAQRAFLKVDPPTSFELAKSVLESRCVECHGPGGSQQEKPLNLLTEQEFIDSGWIVPSDIDSSKLIYRTQGYPNGGVSANMPTNGSLPQGEYQILADWVASMADTVPPNLSIQSPQAETQAENGVLLAGICESGASDIQVTGDIESQSPVNCTASGHFSVSVVFNSGLGTKVVTVTQKDLAQNESMDSRSFQRVDTAAPLVQIIAPDHGTQNAVGLMISGICEAQDSAITLSGHINEANSTVGCSSQNTFEANITFTGSVGAKSVTVSQQDASGNVGSDTREFEMVPPPTAFELAKSVLQNRCVSCHGPGGTEAAKPLNLQTEQAFVDAGWVTPRYLPTSKLVYRTQGYPNGGSAANMPINATLPQSEYQILANWVSNMQDSLAPVVVITSPQEGTQNENGLNILGQCEFGASDVVISGDITAINPVPCTSSGSFSASITFTAGLGTKKVQVLQQDAAGNVGSNYRNFEKVDKAPPIVQIQSPEAQTQDSEGVQISGICEVGASDLTLSGDILETGSHLSCESTGQFSVVVRFTSGDGIKTISVSQIDDSGNVGSDSRDFEKIPELTNFELAKAVIQNRCVSCHGPGGSRSSKPLNLQTEQEFIDAGWVEAQNIHQSKLIYRTQGYPGGGNSNMPTNASLPQAEYQILEDWVNSMNDNIAPILTISSPQEGTETENSLNVVGTCEVGARDIVLSGDILSHPAISCTSLGLFSTNVIFTAGLGNKMLTFSQQDTSGNTGSISRNFIKVDNAAPVIEITSPAAGTKDITGLTISGICEYGASAITLGGDILETGDITTCSMMGQFMTTVNFTEGVGVKTVTVAQQDDSSNVGSDSRDFERLDQEIDPPLPPQAIVIDFNDFVDTGSSNSLQADDSLFQVTDVDGTQALMTSSTSTNIHSHYMTNLFSEFEFTGQMMFDNADGGVGLTFLSQYRQMDQYYRLRRYGGKQVFHSNPHGNTGCIMDTNVASSPGIWYRFKVTTKIEDSKNIIEMSVWPEGQSEPVSPQIQCEDTTSGRPTEGRIGVWSMGGGKKYWSDFKIQLPKPPPTAEERFLSARSIIQSRCVSCHRSGGAAGFANFNLATEDEFVSAGFVIPQVIDQSKLIYRTVHYNGPTFASHDMPTQDTASFTIDEYNILVDWVNQMAIRNLSSTTGQAHSTNFGGTGDDNALAPSGQTEFLDSDELFVKNGFQNKCFQNPSNSGSKRPMRRLTSYELKNTLDDLLIVLTNSTVAQAIMDQVQGALSAVPEDTVPEDDIHLLSTASSSVKISHAEAYFELSYQLANQLMNHQAELLGSCASHVDSACIEQFLEQKAKYIFRRPLNTEEINHYKNLYALSDLKTLFSVLFIAPQFLFHGEYSHADADNIDVFQLGSFELASRLSYALWGSMPDSSLFAKAESGQILQNNVYQAEVERLFANFKAKKQMRQFVSEWLDLEKVGSINISDVKTSLLWNTQGQISDITDPSQLRNDQIQEVLDIANYYVFDAPHESKRLSALMLTRLTNSSDQLRNSIYKNDSLSSHSSGFMIFADGNRRGLLSRAALNIIDGRTRRPILKGVKVMDRFLCRELTPPADNATPTGVVIEPHYTTRERVVAITEKSGTSCVSCHSSINPFGFAFEKFDPFGRISDTEHIFPAMEENPSNFLTTRTVNTQSSIFVDGVNFSVDGPAEINRVMAESFEVHRCFTKYWWRFVNRRHENENADSCQMQDTYKHLESNDGGLQKGLLEMLTHPNFKQRKL